MINDPEIRVCCDGIGCTEDYTVTPNFMYGGTMHTKGEFDCSDEAVCKKLTREGWICRDGRQFCCPTCAGLAV